MVSKRFNARLDISHRGPPHVSKYAWIVDSPSGIYNAMLKCLFVDNRNCIHKIFLVSPQEKVQNIKIWRPWRPYSGSSSTYGSRQMLLKTSRTVWVKCAGVPILHVPHSCSASGTSSNSFGRSCMRIFRPWLPVTRYDKTCGHTIH